MTAVRVRGVRASYRATTVLRGVDLDIHDGSRTAVLGPSGCGKTTLLRVVAGFHRPDAGTVAFGGVDVVDSPPERRGIGYVPQDGSLFPHLTAGQNVLFGLPRRQRRDAARVRDLLDLVGLDPALAGRRPDQLSGGQQQRVALARALAPEPGLVLLDEPFSALDAAARVSTRRAVAEVLARTGVTVLLVTHDQAEALSFADQVAVMRDGRFAQIGPPADVYGAPADLEAARFVGEAVLVPGVATGGSVTFALGTAVTLDDVEGEVEVLLRPEQLVVSEQDHANPASVVGCDYFGHDALLALRLKISGVTVVARVHGQDVVRPGTRVGVTVSGPVRAFPRP